MSLIRRHSKADNAQADFSSIHVLINRACSLAGRDAQRAGRISSAGKSPSYDSTWTPTGRCVSFKKIPQITELYEYLKL